MSDCPILRIRKKLYAKAMLHSSTYQSAKLHHVVQRKRIDQQLPQKIIHSHCTKGL